MPVTKHNWLITDAQDIPRIVREAFHVATTGRPGPVLVDLPKDVANQPMDWYWPEKVDLPGYKPNVKGHPKQIKDAARLINEARAAGDLRGRRHPEGRARRSELRELAELTGIPAVTTLMGRGALPDEHPLCLGMPGMHGNYTAVTVDAEGRPARSRSARASTTVSPARSSAFAPDAKVIHVDIDPAELGKVRRADVPIVGDVRTVIDEMIKAVKAEQAKHERARPRAVDRADPRVAGASTRSSTRRKKAGRSSRSSSSRRCATTRPTTASSWPASASTRCGRASSGSSSSRTRG